MDRRVVVAMLVSVAFLMLYSLLQGLYAPAAPPLEERGAVVQGTPGASTDVPQPGGDQPPPIAPVVPPVALPLAPAAAAADGPEEIVELESGRLSFAASSRGGALNSVDVFACAYHEPHGDAAGASGAAGGDPGRTTERPAGQPGLLSLDFAAGVGLDLHTRTWAVERNGGTLVARLTVPELGIEIEKRIRPSTDPDAPYHADVDIVFRGAGAPSPRTALVEIVGPWLAETATPRPEDALLVSGRGDDIDDLTPTSVDGLLEDDPAYTRVAPDGVGMVGARADFHLGALTPRGDARKTEIGFRRAERPAHAVPAGGAKSGEDAPVWHTAAAVLFESVTLPADGETTTLSYRYFAGPNSRPLFATEGSPYADLAGAVPQRSFLGMSFGPIERVLAWLLNLLAGTGLGYGWAVVCLTVLVRGAMFPLSRKSQVSMRIHGKKMAMLKPKMDAIKKKYKDSRKQQEMTMALMREEKVSILPGGCLLAFLQMPIWIALYGILQTTFELRHASFLWAQDLTAPDHLLEVPWLRGVWGIGGMTMGWFNLLPILMMITWGISSHMTPLPDDPQQRQQAKMMRWMPMLFGVFLYSFASGLTLYMTMSAIWSICEVQVIRRVWLDKIDAEYASRMPGS